MSLISTFLGKQDNQQMTVFRTLASLLDAGTPLVDALGECYGMTENSEMRHLLGRVRDAVNAGQSFSNALDAEPSVPQLISAIVRTAENTGTLPDALAEAADILELRHEWSQNVVSALMYPAVIMSVTLLATVFLASAVTPQIAAMYTQAGRDVPFITRFAGYAGRLAVLCAVALIVYILILRCRRNRLPQPAAQTKPDRFSKVMNPCLRKFRFFTYLNQAHGTALWTHSLGILLSHGVPLPEALELAARTVSPTSGIPVELRDVRGRIISGENPGQAFRSVLTASPLARRLLAGGDAAGNLADACYRVHRISRTEYRNRARRLAALAEPVAVVIAGCFVILAALAVILPIAELGGML